MITDKLTQSIAEAYKKMREELVGGQKNLDVNKNNKVDSQDLAILRAKKKELMPAYMAHVIHGILSLYHNGMHMTFWLQELL
jgi:hypothetical protein